MSYVGGKNKVSRNSFFYFRIKHSEENITVDCEIKTMNVDDSPDVSLAEECNLNKVVVNASILTEVLQRLDNAAEELSIEINPEPPHFILTTTGIAVRILPHF